MRTNIDITGYDLEIIWNYHHYAVLAVTGMPLPHAFVLTDALNTPMTKVNLYRADEIDTRILISPNPPSAHQPGSNARIMIQASPRIVECATQYVDDLQHRTAPTLVARLGNADERKHYIWRRYGPGAQARYLDITTAGPLSEADWDDLTNKHDQDNTLAQKIEYTEEDILSPYLHEAIRGMTPCENDEAEKIGRDLDEIMS